jgi:hypothetical protein
MVRTNGREDPKDMAMARRTKREYVASIYGRYQQARRAEKRAILDEFTKVCGYHRKSAIRLLSQPLAADTQPRRSVARPPEYSAAAIRLLASVWESSGYLCAARLKAALPTWWPWIRQRFRVPPRLEAQVLAISPRQLDRRLRDYKRTLKRRLYGTTRPGSLLKHLIPIKTDHWDVTTPGYLEIDLVSHSGASAAGEFLHTLDSVDIQTGWVERQAVLGKSQHGILQALTMIERQLPFARRGIDSDNGSEFINAHLVAFCQGRQRPYRAEELDARPQAGGLGSLRHPGGPAGPQRAVRRPANFPEPVPALDEAGDEGAQGLAADSPL